MDGLSQQERNRRIVARYWQEFWTTANPEIVDELCSQDVVNFYPMHGRLDGRTAVKDMLRSFKMVRQFRSGG